MLASCFVVFRTREKETMLCAVWKDEHEHKAKTETKTGVSFFFFFLKPKTETAVLG